MPRKSTGCWTCRLRHKKCDELRPKCGGCSALDISCHYGATKPEWMDGGRRQREMVQCLRDEVKRGSERRRSKGLRTNTPRREVDDAQMSTSSQGLRDSASDNAVGSSNSEDRNTIPVRTASSLIADSDTSPSLSANPSPIWTYSRPTPPVSGITPDTPRTDSAGPSRNELELTLTLVYIDYVFPILFPFYRPPLPQGGRAWLLVLAQQHDALFHIITSLTSYFLSVVRVAPDPGYTQCTANTWGELQKQTDLTVKDVQRDLQIVNTRGVDADPVASTRLLASIVHLLNLEVIVSPLGNWKIHLDAGIELFRQIFKHHGTNSYSAPPTFSAILDKMGYISETAIPAGGPPVLGSDQAAFRFFCAILLFQDIISSTTLEHPPQLKSYHQDLLPDCASSGGYAQLQLEEFVGCQNWVLLCISDIAALDVWKRERKRDGALSIKQLAQKATTIEEQLDRGLSKIENTDPPQQDPKTLWIFRVLSESKLDDVRPRESSISVTTTRIWAYAARAYLNTVLSGWQPGDPEIRQDIAHVIDLLLGLPSVGWLRTLVWPFCVAGCLAQEHQEASFRDVVGSMEGLESFGTMHVALNIMEGVWKKRGEVGADWDLGACFQELGNRVLLI